MRDLVVTLIVFGSLPYILMRPYVGIYLWAWIGYMNPHRLGWGFAVDFPFALIIGVSTMVGLLFFKEKKRIPICGVTVVLFIFIIWMAITTIFATNLELAVDQLIKVIKIQLMTIITLMLIVERKRMHVFVWVIAASIGFFGVKGGIFTLITGGEYLVLGPRDTFFEGNTSIALAVTMVLPLLRYLQLQEKNKWIRWGLVVAMALCAVSVAGSYSRGAFLAGAAMGVFMVLKSRKKFVFALVLVLLIPAILAFMPERYSDRMNTIQNYEQDASALGRIGAWQFAWEMAKARVVGGGFEAFKPDNYILYAPEVFVSLLEKTGRLPDNMPDAHSIYFEVLGEHGFIGLGLFLLLGGLAWRTGTWTIKRAPPTEEFQWARDLASMVQVSLIGYAVGGAFLGLAYFDLYYHLAAILVLLKLQVSRSLTEENQGTQPTLRRQGVSTQHRNGY